VLPQLGAASASGSAKPAFNWVAFIGGTAMEADRTTDYGSASNAGWEEYLGSNKIVNHKGRGGSNAQYADAGITKYDGYNSTGIRQIFVTCQTIGFSNGVTFTTPPTVLVMANHRDDQDKDWNSAARHPETMTWLDAVGTEDFRVCATERATKAAGAQTIERDNTLKFDWLAIRRKNTDPSEMTRSTGATVNRLATSVV